MGEANIMTNRNITMKSPKADVLAELLKHRYAHRGLHKKPAIPENSMAAFRLAVEHGFGMEMDLHLTKDGKLAVIHDASLLRTAGVDLIIEDMTLEEAQKYVLEESEGEVIPDFQELLDLVAGQVPLIVELKVGKTSEGVDTTDALCRKAAEMMDAYTEKYSASAPTLWCIESFSPTAVKWFRENRPDIIRGQLAGDINHDKPTITPFQNFLVRQLLINFISKPDFVAYNYRDRFDGGVRRWKGPLFYYTIKSYEDLMELEGRGAAGIFEQFDPSAQ